MPEMTFRVRWPDGVEQECYSPSLVIHDFLEVDAAYSVDDFIARTTQALSGADDRVRERLGFMCTSALATTGQIRSAADRYPDEATVRVLSMMPPLPGRHA